MEILELLSDLVGPIIPKDAVHGLPRWVEWPIVAGLLALMIWIVVDFLR